MIGANYEGGKIIRYALESNQCISYANIQIAMDSPFHGEVASEEVRAKYRSEKQFENYSDEKLKKQLLVIFSYIIKKYPNIELIVQIARGRSANLTEIEILKPIMIELNFTRYRVFYGYRRQNYFPYPENNFVFINVGMFARLTHIDIIKAGDVCNPIETYDIYETSPSNKKLIKKNYHEFNDINNILNYLNVTKITLYGIDDNMPFITPDNYSKTLFDDLINEH